MPIAQNWLLLLSYEGTYYHGWQVQPDCPTIANTIEQALKRLTGENIRIHGSGRTDSGVHALNYTANFKTSSKKFSSPEKWRIALNALLPQDIVVKCVQKIPLDFHARHSAIRKRYCYLISNLPYRQVFSIKQSWWINETLDIFEMDKAGQILIGEHDFSAFRASNCSSPNPTKNISEILIRENSLRYSTIQIEVEANSFLQHMVRIICGTLVEVGQGRKTLDDIVKALRSGNRNLAGITAPAHGLYSMNVIYPNGIIKWPKDVIDK